MPTPHDPRHFQRVLRQRFAYPLDLAQQALPRPCNNAGILLAAFMDGDIENTIKLSILQIDS
jgi:hypothetical protein